MDDAAPEPGAAAEKKRPLLRRIPTPLIATLVGIALTAWLLPAFTRQWDDRQKAHELKAALVVDMASATARALTDGENLLYSPAPTTARPSPALQNWSRESLQIEARLRAYLPAAAVDEWDTYAVLVDNGLAVAGNTPASDLRGLTAMPRDARYHQSRAYESAWSAAWISLDRFFRDSFSLLFVRGDSADRVTAYAKLEGNLVKVNQVVAAEVLRSHLDGYSTTSHDLIHDLIP
jgi:hypothetical protein